jgi:hypothetical protein
MKSRPLKSYQEAILAHSARVVKLQQKIDSKEEFDCLYDNSKEAPETVAAAREELGPPHRGARLLKP